MVVRAAGPAKKTCKLQWSFEVNMTDLVKVLHVEDDPEILEISGMALTLVGGLDIVQVDRGEKALDVVADFNPQLVSIYSIDNFSTVYISRFFLRSTDKYPTLPNCAELYSLGFTLPGTYRIKIGGTTVSAYCKDSWTIILKRGQYGNSEVNTNTDLCKAYDNL